MDFINLYREFKNMKLGCDITKFFKINRILFGSGGSINIILDVVDKHNNKLILKVIPDMIYVNTKIKPDRHLLEIKFYQFLTQKYILTDRTPHIVGIFNHQVCPNLNKFLNTIKPSKKKCPSYEDRLMKNIDIGLVNHKICGLLLETEMKLLNSTFDIILMERCDDDFSHIIDFFMTQIKSTSGARLKNITDDFIYNLSRVLFQLIFTLAIIKDDYPGFIHGDFFVRNILVSFENMYKDNDYVAYHYKQKIFYLPANGVYAKMNDFGLTIIANELEPSTHKDEKDLDKYYHKNPFNQKTDIFNLLHDIYDGQNLGTMSINGLAEELKIPIKKITPIKNFLRHLFSVNIIDHINNTNMNLLNETWDIDNITVLEKTVQTPDKYLTKNYFETFQHLPADAKIIRHFNRAK